MLYPLASQSADTEDLVSYGDALVAAIRTAEISSDLRYAGFQRILLVEHGSSTLDEKKIRKGGLTLLQKAGHDLESAKGRSQDSLLQELQESPQTNHLLSVDPSLSVNGILQAKRAGIIMDQVRKNGLLASPHSCYTSHQNRALHTAYQMGFEATIDLPHFNERIMMPQAGQTKQRIAEWYPDIAQQMNDGLPLEHPGIEDMEFFLARIARGMEIVKQENSCTEDDPSFGKWQVIVTHQTIIKMLIASSINSGEKIDPFAIDVPNCSITPLLVGNRSLTNNERTWHRNYHDTHALAVPQSNVFNPKSLLHDDWNTLNSRSVTVPVLPSVIYKDHCDVHH